jgi:23S rRNA pseudouridine955/2504/2580 synthase
VKKLRFKDLIVFENDHYIGINKPAGISSLHERIGISESIFEAAKRYNEDFQLCHRLDKETSGILLISKHNDAYKNAAMQFEKRQVKKEYHAICDGVHNFDGVEIDLPLVTTRSGRSSINKQRGKESKTVFNSLEIFGNYTLVSCSPESGRLHQIRIHLASQSAPITADEIYGGTQPYLSKIKRNFSMAKDDSETPMIARFALHAHSLEFTGMDGAVIKIEANYTKDFAVFLKLLRKYNKYQL